VHFRREEKVQSLSDRTGGGGGGGRGKGEESRWIEMEGWMGRVRKRKSNEKK
jgi:hypothetical protein